MREKEGGELGWRREEQLGRVLRGLELTPSVVPMAAVQSTAESIAHQLSTSASVRTIGSMASAAASAAASAIGPAWDNVSRTGAAPLPAWLLELPGTWYEHGYDTYYFLKIRKYSRLVILMALQTLRVHLSSTSTTGMTTGVGWF